MYTSVTNTIAIAVKSPTNELKQACRLENRPREQTLQLSESA